MSDKQSSAHAHVKSVTLDAVVIRADGSREDLGRLAEWHADDPEPTTSTTPGTVRFTYGE